MSDCYDSCATCDRRIDSYGRDGTHCAACIAAADFDDAPKDCPSCGEVLENGSCAVGCLDKPIKRARHVLTDRVVKRRKAA